jgi:hypothetical protein
MAGVVVVAEGVGVVVRMGSLETKAAGVRHAAEGSSKSPCAIFILVLHAIICNIIIL